MTGKIILQKETIKNKKLKSIQEMASIILINDMATSHSKMLATSCTICLNLFGTVGTEEK